MYKFYQLSTEKYKPLSFDNTYLFNQYDKVQNFIKTRIGSEYKNLLAKPVKHGFEIEWYSPFLDLNEITHEDNILLQQYWHFKDKLEEQIQMISSSNDEDAQNWITLLGLVFEPKNNVIYSNGSDFCIIWGWVFENNSIQRPMLGEFISDHPSSQENELIDTSENVDEHKNEPVESDSIPEINEEPITEDPFLQKPEKVEDFFIENDIIEDEVLEPKKSFLDFLKDFAAKYWWLLVVLLILIVLVYLFKTI